jgi:hypothetical protein
MADLSPTARRSCAPAGPNQGFAALVLHVAGLLADEDHPRPGRTRPNAVWVASRYRSQPWQERAARAQGVQVRTGRDKGG